MEMPNFDKEAATKPALKRNIIITIPESRQIGPLLWKEMLFHYKTFHYINSLEKIVWNSNLMDDVFAQEMCRNARHSWRIPSQQTNDPKRFSLDHSSFPKQA